MDDTRLRTALVELSADLAATPDDALDLDVPACAGWSVTRLIDHLARVQLWCAGVVRTPADGEAPAAPRRPEGTDPRTFLAEATAGLLAAVDEVGPDAEVATFTGTGPARFWLRRQVHEAFVHAADGREARGLPAPTIDPEVAVDGVDEVVDVVLPGGFDLGAFGGAGETIHLHATDAEGEWLLRFPAEGDVEVERAHAKGDVAARGPAADLLLLLWSRRHPEELEVFGDADLLVRYQAAADY